MVNLNPVVYMKHDDATGLPAKLWSHFNNREWDLAKALLSDNFEADFVAFFRKLFHEAGVCGIGPIGFLNG